MRAGATHRWVLLFLWAGLCGACATAPAPTALVAPTAPASVTAPAPAPPEVAADIAGLIPQLGNPDPRVSAAARDALIAIGQPGLLPLLQAIDDSERRFGSRQREWFIAAKETLDALGPHPPATLIYLLTRGRYAPEWALQQIRSQGLEAEAIPTILRRMHEGNRADTQWALNALKSFGPKAAPAIPDLVGLLGATLLTPEAVLGAIGAAALPIAERLLQAPDALSRSQGLRILGYMRPLPLQRLRGFAAGSDVSLRRQAVDILVDAKGFDLQGLLDLSRDPDSFVRRLSITPLSRVSPWDDRAGEALVRLLLEDPEKYNRSRAAEAFGWMTFAWAPATVALERALADPDEHVRRSAAAVLAKIRPAGAESPQIGAATQSLASGDVAQVRAALGVLRTAGRDAAPALPALLEVAPTIPPDLAGEYLETLTRVGRRDPRLVPIYVDALGRGVGGRFAREGLAWFGDEAAAPLIELLRERDAPQRSELGKTFAEHRDGAIPALEAALNGDAVLARHAALVLCDLSAVSPEAIRVFLAVLRQDEPGTWRSPLACLLQAGPALAPHADFLAGLYAQAEDADKSLVVLALGECGEAALPHVPFLLALARDPAAPEVRGTPPRRSKRRISAGEDAAQRAAIAALIRLGDPALPLVPMLAQQAAAPTARGDSLQRAAIWALRDMGPRAGAAVPTLVPLLHGPEDLAGEVMNALIAIQAAPDILIPHCLALLRDPQARHAKEALQYLLQSGHDDEALTELLEQLAPGPALGFMATQELRRRRPPRGGVPLAAPVLLFPGLTSWGVELKWGPGVPGARAYRVYRRELPAEDWGLLEEVGHAGFSDHTALPGRVYAYRVMAYNADVEGPFSNEEEIPTWGGEVREQLAPPTALTVDTEFVVRGGRRIRVARLTWEPPRGWDCRGYAIFRRSEELGSAGPVGVSTAASFVDEESAADRTVLYSVRGIDEHFRRSEASNEILAPADPGR